MTPTEPEQPDEPEPDEPEPEMDTEGMGRDERDD
jgi:hypothetical protein